MYFKLTHSEVNNGCYDLLRQGILGMLPLHLAALYGFPDCCRKLLCNGENVFDASSCTPHFILPVSTHLSTDTVQSVIVVCVSFRPVLQHPAVSDRQPDAVIWV